MPSIVIDNDTKLICFLLLNSKFDKSEHITSLHLTVSSEIFFCADDWKGIRNMTHVNLYRKVQKY